MEEFIRQIKFRKKVGTYLIILFVFLIASAFFFLTASETWNYGIEKLGEERYNARMKDSYLYAFLLMLMAVPLVISLNPFIKAYIQVVQTLSKSEMERLQKQNETAPILNRYLPGYIAKEKSVVFFKFLRTTEIPYADITKVKLSRARGGYFLHIKTKSSFFIASMGESYLNLSQLADFIKEANPEVIVSKPSRS